MKKLFLSATCISFFCCLFLTGCLAPRVKLGPAYQPVAHIPNDRGLIHIYEKEDGPTMSLFYIGYPWLIEGPAEDMRALYPGSYMTKSVKPGPVYIHSLVFNRVNPEITVEVKPGQEYFLRVRKDNSLELVPHKVGWVEIASTKRTPGENAVEPGKPEYLAVVDCPDFQECLKLKTDIDKFRHNPFKDILHMQLSCSKGKCPEQTMDVLRKNSADRNCRMGYYHKLIYYNKSFLPAYLELAEDYLSRFIIVTANKHFWAWKANLQIIRPGALANLTKGLASLQTALALVGKMQGKYSQAAALLVKLEKDYSMFAKRMDKTLFYKGSPDLSALSAQVAKLIEQIRKTQVLLLVNSLENDIRRMEKNRPSQ